MSNYDIHEMMDRAHFAEIREQRLRIEVDRLKAENAGLAAALRVARERLLDWAAYASADRTRLAQDLAAIDAALSPQETPK